MYALRMKPNGIRAALIKSMISSIHGPSPAAFTMTYNILPMFSGFFYYLQNTNSYANFCCWENRGRLYGFFKENYGGVRWNTFPSKRAKEPPPLTPSQHRSMPLGYQNSVHRQDIDDCGHRHREVASTQAFDMVLATRGDRRKALTRSLPSVLLSITLDVFSKDKSGKFLSRGVVRVLVFKFERAKVPYCIFRLSTNMLTKD